MILLLIHLQFLVAYYLHHSLDLRIWKKHGERSVLPQNHTHWVSERKRGSCHVLILCIELLLFAYLAQCRCDPAGTMIYFTHLNSIATAMMNNGVPVPTELQALILDERARFRYTTQDYHERISLLGFGRDGELGFELDSEVDDQFIAEAWRSARRRTWHDPERGSETRNKLNEALRYVADQRHSSLLRKVWDEEIGTGMSPEGAYKALEVPSDVDDSMLLTVFSLRVRNLYVIRDISLF